MEITTTVLDPSSLQREESIFHTANGYLGIRGCFEEGYPEGIDSVRGCYVNGFYDYTAISNPKYPRSFPGTARRMINLPDMQTTRLIIDGEEFSPFRGSVHEYRRTLDMASGTTERRVRWRSPKGRELIVSFKRMASLRLKELFLTEIRVESTNGSGELTVISECNCAVYNSSGECGTRAASAQNRHIHMTSAEISGANRAAAHCETAASGLSLTAAMALRSERGRASVSLTPGGFRITMAAAYGDKPTVIEKFCVYSDSLRNPDFAGRASEALDEAMAQSSENLFAEQAYHVGRFWEECGVTVHGCDKISEGMSFNLYGLLQSSGDDGIGSISSRGLSGEACDGHSSSDAEIYTFPFFLFTRPKQAKAMLNRRYSALEDAKENARILGHNRGALYSIDAECPTNYFTGSSRYHMNGDVAHAFLQYYQATGDIGFMAEKGVDVLVETARLWLDAGQYDRLGRLCFNCVTGPDEYSPIADNNYYTNLAAKHNLLGAVYICGKLRESDAYDDAAARLGLSGEELNAFQAAADDIYLPYDADLDINLRDDSFLCKTKWDLEATPKEYLPLSAHYHPLCIYRHQVCSQSDVILAHYLFEDAAESTTLNSYNYYESITTHDSTLSTCPFSIVASRLGMPEKAYDYFLQNVRADLDDARGNTEHGLHPANMGGAYLAVTAGFAGLRIREDGPRFHFTLPEQWTGYEFNLRWAESLLHVSVKADDVKFTLISGKPVLLFVDDMSYVVRDTSSLKNAVHKPSRV